MYYSLLNFNNFILTSWLNLKNLVVKSTVLQSKHSTMYTMFWNFHHFCICYAYSRTLIYLHFVLFSIKAHSRTLIYLYFVLFSINIDITRLIREFLIAIGWQNLLKISRFLARVVICYVITAGKLDQVPLRIFIFYFC